MLQVSSNISERLACLKECSCFSRMGGGVTQSYQTCVRAELRVLGWNVCCCLTSRGVLSHTQAGSSTSWSCWRREKTKTWGGGGEAVCPSTDLYSTMNGGGKGEGGGGQGGQCQSLHCAHLPKHPPVFLCLPHSPPSLPCLSITPWGLLGWQKKKRRRRRVDMVLSVWAVCPSGPGTGSEGPKVELPIPSLPLYPPPPPFTGTPFEGMRQRACWAGLGWAEN